MRDLIDTPIYTTANISHIHGWPTAYVRKGLGYRQLWSPEDLDIVQKIDNQIVASYRDFIFLDIFHFFIEERIPPKRRSNILAEIAKNEDLFYEPEFELATDGAEVFRKQSFGQEIYDGVNIETRQRSFVEFLEPIQIDNDNNESIKAVTQKAHAKITEKYNELNEEVKNSYKVESK